MSCTSSGLFINVKHGVVAGCVWKNFEFHSNWTAYTARNQFRGCNASMGTTLRTVKTVWLRCAHRFRSELDYRAAGSLVGTWNYAVWMAEAGYLDTDFGISIGLRAAECWKFCGGGDSRIAGKRRQLRNLFVWFAEQAVKTKCPGFFIVEKRSKQKLKWG